MAKKEPPAIVGYFIGGVFSRTEAAKIGEMIDYLYANGASNISMDPVHATPPAKRLASDHPSQIPLPANLPALPPPPEPRLGTAQAILALVKKKGPTTRVFVRKQLVEEGYHAPSVDSMMWNMINKSGLLFAKGDTIAVRSKRSLQDFLRKQRKANNKPSPPGKWPKIKQGTQRELMLEALRRNPGGLTSGQARDVFARAKFRKNSASVALTALKTEGLVKHDAKAHTYTLIEDSPPSQPQEVTNG